MKIIIFSGLPGTGKSTLAEAVGRNLCMPVFAKDWLEAVLLQSELQPGSEDRSLGFAAYELLTVLAERQLLLGQSVILDSVAASQSIRSTWQQLAEAYRADYRVVEFVQMSPFTGPGWHELEWSDVERVKQYYVPWDAERLVLDMIEPFEDNVLKARAYCLAQIG